MIFSAQGLLDTKSAVSANGAEASGKINTSGKSGISGKDTESPDFLNFMMRAAGKDSAEAEAQPKESKNLSSSIRAGLRDELLDFLRSNFADSIYPADNDSGRAAFHAGNAAEAKAEKTSLLQSREAGIDDLLKAFVLYLQGEGQLNNATAADGSAAGVLGQLQEFLSAGREPGSVVGSRDAAQLIEALKQHLESRGAGAGADQNGQSGKTAGSREVSRILEALDVRGMSSETPNRSEGSRDGATTDAPGRLRAFLSAAGEKSAGADRSSLPDLKEGLQRSGENSTDAKADQNGQTRKIADSRELSRFLDALEGRNRFADTTNRSDKAKEGSPSSGTGRLQAFLSAAGDKNRDAARPFMSGIQENLQHLVKAAQDGKPVVKPANTDKGGQEILNFSRQSAEMGGKPETGPISSRQTSGVFDRHLQAEESRVVSQVSLRLSSGLKQGSKNLTIHMHPPELGSVKVSIVSDGTSLNVQLHSQNQQVAGILDRHLPGLQQSLADQGVSVSNLQVSVDSGKDQGGSQFEDQGFGASDRHATPEEPGGDDETTAAAGPDPALSPGGQGQGLSLRV